jgi:hypothetical protein
MEARMKQKESSIWENLMWTILLIFIIYEGLIILTNQIIAGNL